MTHLPCTSIKILEENETGVLFQCGNRRPFLLLDRFNKVIAIIPYKVQRYEGERIKYEKCFPLTNYQKIYGIKGGYVCEEFVGIIRKDGKTIYYKKKE